jgi:hypothetical protein
MIPEATSNLIVSEVSEELSTNEPWSIETYAEGLMDELFVDIDNILEGRVKHSSPPTARTVRKSPASAQFSEVVLPTTVNGSLKTVSVQQVSSASDSPSMALVVQPATVTAITRAAEPKNSGLGKLLILGTSITVAMVGMLYLTESGSLTNISANWSNQTLLAPQTQTATITQPNPNAELVNYMLAALEVIDQPGTSNRQTSGRTGFPDVNLHQKNALALPTTQSLGTLPPPLTANNTIPIPGQSTNVVERIYIPVYQAPPPMRYPIPPVPALPASISSTLPLPQPGKNQPVQNKPKVENAGVGKNPLAAVKPATIKSQPLPIGQPKMPTAAPLPPTTTVQPTLPKYSAELEGLLELGQKSAALFKIDGVTRRINLGESIGASGWTLVEVSKGEAIIRRNGEVRSIYAGQKL